MTLLKTKTLTPEAYHVLCESGTEAPNTGKFNLTDGQGTYLCRQCGIALFRSDQKFISSCGWPSFDDEISGRIKRLPDPDGRRTEIRCDRCDGHLGHVFTGEGYTEKSLRHCVNSLSIDFVLDSKVDDTEEAIFAGGCFWGVEHLIAELPGVLFTEVGFSGEGVGPTPPTYENVCAGVTMRLEAVRVVYDPKLLSYESVTKRFLEIHDPTQQNGQGPDIGPQYASAIFYFDNFQQEIAANLLKQLENKGLTIVTKLMTATVFWPAEEKHQQYYKKTGKAPYCHIRREIFD